MSKTQVRCETCAFWDDKAPQLIRLEGIEIKYRLGLCRLNPPAISGAFSGAGTWPMTLNVDWCAHYHDQSPPYFGEELPPDAS